MNTNAINAKAIRLVEAQSTGALLKSLAHLEEIAPEPANPEMREWCRMVDWVESALIKRLGCEEAHTDWVLSEDFGMDESRTSYAFLAAEYAQ